MKKVYEYLEQLGLSPIEAKMYLTLLEAGTLSVSELASKIKINRTAVYPHITSLINKGVVFELRKATRKQIQAIEPERLHYLIDNKLDAINMLDKQFPTIVQSLNTSSHKYTNEVKADIKYYSGKENLKAIYKDSFKANEIRSYVKILGTNDSKKFFPDNLTTYLEAFKQNPKLIMKEIFYDTPFSYADGQVLSKNKRFFYKFMPKNIQLSTQDILIYDNVVAIINYEKNIEAIVLNNTYFYKNSKELFDFIWQMLPEPQA
jgi:sugar-specific transcriptional regulator TrmB